MTVETEVWTGSNEPVQINMQELKQQPPAARLFTLGQVILDMEDVEIERATSLAENNMALNQRRLPHATQTGTYLVARAAANGHDGFAFSPASIACGVINPEGEEMYIELFRGRLSKMTEETPYDLMLADYFESHFNAIQTD